jgi:hypothetical protein
MAVLARAAVEAQRLAVQQQMMVGRSDVDPPALDPGPVGRRRRRQPTGAREDVAEH